MFTLYYATQYIFQSLKLMVSRLEWPHLQITILLLKMNSTPWWGEKSSSLNSGEWFHTGPYHIIYARALSLHSWLNIWMSESFNKTSNHRERLSIWGGVSHSLGGSTDTFYYFLFRFKYTAFAWMCKVIVKQAVEQLKAEYAMHKTQYNHRNGSSWLYASYKWYIYYVLYYILYSTTGLHGLKQLFCIRCYSRWEHPVLAQTVSVLVIHFPPAECRLPFNS